MKILNSKLVSLLLLLIIVLGFENCRFYKKRDLSGSLQIQDYLERNSDVITANYEVSKDSLGINHKTRKLSKKYNYFVHYKGIIYGVSNVRIDSALNRIVFSEYTRWPDGKETNYYENIETGQFKLRKRHAIDKKAIRQVHFLLNSRNVNELLDNKMFYAKDITKIEVLKSAHGLNFISTVSCTAMSLILYGTVLLYLVVEGVI